MFTLGTSIQNDKRQNSYPSLNPESRSRSIRISKGHPSAISSSRVPVTREIYSVSLIGCTQQLSLCDLLVLSSEH